MHDSPVRNRHATAGEFPATTGMTIHPWYWWGALGGPAAPPGLSELIERGVLSPAVAALLAAAAHAGLSIAAIAVPGGAGKTTLLTALAAAIPPVHRQLHLRGSYDDFSAFDAPETTPGTAAIMVNELSDHLPVYLWGDGVSRLMSLRQAGFQVFATAHATDSAALADLLAGPGVRLPEDAAARLFDLVVSLKSGITVHCVESMPQAAASVGIAPLPGDANAEMVSEWLRGSAAAGSPTGRIDRAELGKWEAWATTDHPRPTSQHRPGAMLAKSEADHERSRGT